MAHNSIFNMAAVAAIFEIGSESLVEYLVPSFVGTSLQRFSIIGQFDPKEIRLIAVNNFQGHGKVKGHTISNFALHIFGP